MRLKLVKTWILGETDQQTKHRAPYKRGSNNNSKFQNIKIEETPN